MVDDMKAPHPFDMVKQIVNEILSDEIEREDGQDELDPGRHVDEV